MLLVGVAEPEDVTLCSIQHATSSTQHPASSVRRLDSANRTSPPPPKPAVTGEELRAASQSVGPARSRQGPYAGVIDTVMPDQRQRRPIRGG
jgi:hypothetical protein